MRALGVLFALALAGFLSSQCEAQTDDASPAQQPQQQEQPADQLRPSPIAQSPNALAVPEKQQPKHIYKSACGETTDHNEADLCEQRRMAQAAIDAVWWASFQTWLSAFGFGAVFLTLFFSAVAAIAASRQVRLSRTSLVDTNRAFVYPDDVIWRTVADVNTQQVKRWTVAIKWRNSGETPTRHLRIFTNLHFREGTLLPEDFNFADARSEDIPTLIAPVNTIESAQLDVEMELIDKAVSGNAHIYFYGWAEYDDVFERTPRHRTEFCYKLILGGNPRKANRFSKYWIVHEKYNGADEECGTALRTTSPKKR